MSVTNQPFDLFKIEKLKHFLEEMAAKNLARPYEIFVDNLKVVPKTEDPNQFGSYDSFMDEDTAKLRILIYNSNQSPRNDQYCFFLKAIKTERDTSLGSLGDIDTIIQEKLKERDREYETQELRKELESTQEELEDAESQLKEMAAELLKYKEGKEKRSYNLGVAANSFVTTLVRSPEFAKRFPGGEALAGLLGVGEPSAAEEAAEPAPATDASFSKKNVVSSLNPQELECLAVLKDLYESFDQDEIDLIFQILIAFSQDHGRLNTVADLLQLNNTES